MTATLRSSHPQNFDQGYTVRAGIHANDTNNSVLNEAYGQPRSEALIEQTQPKITVQSGDQLPLESKIFKAVASLAE